MNRKVSRTLGPFYKEETDPFTITISEVILVKILLGKYVFYGLLIYLGLLAFLFLFQRHLLYMPMGKILPIENYLLYGFEEKTFITADQTNILAWYKPAQDGRKIILYFHGNGGNMGGRDHRFAAFAQAGYGVLAISYRGYPGS